MWHPGDAMIAIRKSGLLREGRKIQIFIKMIYKIGYDYLRGFKPACAARSAEVLLRGSLISAALRLGVPDEASVVRVSLTKR